MQKTLLKRCVKARGMRAFVRCLGAISTKDLEAGNETWELNRLPTPPIKGKWRGISLIMTSFLRHHDSSATGGERAARPEPLFARPIHLSYDQVPDREERETATSAVRASKNAGISLWSPSRCWQIGRVKTRAAAALRPPNKPENKCGQKRTAAAERRERERDGCLGCLRRKSSFSET